MERYCGRLQAGLRCHAHPWTNLSNRILHKAYLESIVVFYGLEDESIMALKTVPEEETHYPDCELYQSTSIFERLIWVY
jgi:hypothetical protein